MNIQITQILDSAEVNKSIELLIYRAWNTCGQRLTTLPNTSNFVKSTPLFVVFSTLFSLFGMCSNMVFRVWYMTCTRMIQQFCFTKIIFSLLRTWCKRNFQGDLAGSVGTACFLLSNPWWFYNSWVPSKSVRSSEVCGDGISSAQSPQSIKCMWLVSWTFILNGDQNDFTAVRTKIARIKTYKRTKTRKRQR